MPKKKTGKSLEALERPQNVSQVSEEQKAANIAFIDNANDERFRKYIRINSERVDKHFPVSKVPKIVREVTGSTPEEFLKNWATANCKANKFNPDVPCYEKRLVGLHIHEPEPKIIKVYLPTWGMTMASSGLIFLQEDAEWARHQFNGIWLRDWLGLEKPEEKDVLAPLRNPARRFVSVMYLGELRPIFLALPNAEGSHQAHLQKELDKLIDPVAKVCSDPVNLEWFKKYVKLVAEENCDSLGAFNYSYYIRLVENKLAA